MQWELANILYKRDQKLRGRVQRIDLDCDSDYITSYAVVEKFKHMTDGVITPGIFIICQAWHAALLVVSRFAKNKRSELCEENSLTTSRGATHRSGCVTGLPGS